MTPEEINETVDQPSLVLRAEDGAMYAIPQEALETFRLSDEQRAEVEPQLTAAAADEVHGHLLNLYSVVAYSPVRYSAYSAPIVTANLNKPVPPKGTW